MFFLDITIFDVIDILLVATLLYQLYIRVKDTPAITILIGILFIYVLWFAVRELHMQLISTILGQVVGVGVIALIIVFQQEIRRFFLTFGAKYKGRWTLERMFSFLTRRSQLKVDVDSIVQACENMSKTRTGALIVIGRNSPLDPYIESGETFEADTSARLLETIFFKNSPLHDGAVIISARKINAARCVLPVSENPKLPANIGLRHRSAVGISEITDVFVIIVSEETGRIAYAEYGKLTTNITPSKLSELLGEAFGHE